MVRNGRKSIGKVILLNQTKKMIFILMICIIT